MLLTIAQNFPRNAAMGTSRIGELVALISTNTAKVETYLQAHGLPSPSFDVDAPNDLGIPPDATAVDDARRAALEASIELQDLLQGSTSLLRPVVCYLTATIYVVIPVE